MKKLEFKLAEKKKLEVNGKVYTVQTSDTEVIKKAAAVERKLRKIFEGPENGDVTGKQVDASIDALDMLVSGVDEMLGKGALKDITGGPLPSIGECIAMYKAVAEAVIEIYEKDRAAEYE